MSNTTAIQPLVAVVLCTYNGEKYLRPQLDSILAQSWQHLEIIICDDGSSDNTAAILEEYRQKDQRISLHFNTRNLGYNKNFEQAFQLASAEYIAISDQDDIWEPNKIEWMMQKWPDDSFMVYSLSGSFESGHFPDRKAGKLITKDGKIRHLYELIFSGHMHGHACIFRKELLRYCFPFPDDPNLFYDAWLSFYAVSLGPIYCIPYTLTWHRVHTTNSSRSLTSITDSNERNQQLRNQMISFIESFCKKGIGNAKDNQFLLQYADLLKPLDGKKFSRNMFYFIIRNRKKVFHYKGKKIFLAFSHLKHAFKMSRKGLL